MLTKVIRTGLDRHFRQSTGNGSDLDQKGVETFVTGKVGSLLFAALGTYSIQAWGELNQG
jgi:hypothetical protein